MARTLERVQLAPASHVPVWLGGFIDDFATKKFARMKL